MRKTILVIMMAVVSLMGCAQQKSQKAVPMSQSAMQKTLSPLFEKLQSIQLKDSARAECMAFVKENENEAGTYVLCNVLPQFSGTDDLVAFINTNAYYKSDDKVKSSMKVWEVQKTTAEGKPFVDFEATYDGKTQKLSDYVGKGKYVLVDFWASWCGPCKAEIPNLIKVNNAHKGDRFMVLGVATWDKPEATKQAMAQLGVNYPQIMNAQRAGSDAYGIQGIPQIILFGPDGTILKRNLRGAEIEKAVSECLAK